MINTKAMQIAYEVIFNINLNILLIVFISGCIFVNGNSLNTHNFYGVYWNAMDNYVCPSSDVTVTHYGMLSEMQCFYSCATNARCQGIFYHKEDKVCTLCKELYKDTSALQSYPGTNYYRPKASTCSEWSTLHGVTSGTFTITIDPDGLLSTFGDIAVTCDLDSEPGKAFTVLHHDKETRTHVNDYEDCYSYRAELTYTLGIDVAKKIVDVSDQCKQYIKYECHGSGFSSSGGPSCTAWENRFNTTASYFTGNGSSSYYCDCAVYGSCSNPNGCECSQNDFTWRYDDGYVTNKEHLPITAFTAGDTGWYELISGFISELISEEGYHKSVPCYVGKHINVTLTASTIKENHPRWIIT